MSKITSYARSQTHGVSNPLSGATVPVSNDHTDGSWIITDIYDRELMINTGNGKLQYRAGSDIYTVPSITGDTSFRTIEDKSSPLEPDIKFQRLQIGGADLTAGPYVISTFVNGSPLAKNIISIDCVIINDGEDTTFPYSFNPNNAFNTLDIYYNEGSPFTIDIEVNVGTYFDSANYSSTSNNRGWITVYYTL